jgi:hypothetical protein
MDRTETFTLITKWPGREKYRSALPGAEGRVLALGLLATVYRHRFAEIRAEVSRQAMSSTDAASDPAFLADEE